MFSFLPYILSTASLVNLISTFLILTKGEGKQVNKIFALLNFSVSLWSFSILGFYFLRTPLIDPRAWILISHLSASAIALSFLLFSLNFPRDIKKTPKTNWLILIPAVITMAILLFSRGIIGDVEGESYAIGSLYPGFSAYVMVYFISGYFFLYKQLRRAEDQTEKIQVRYVLVGAIFSSTLASVTDLLFPFLGIFKYTWLGPIFTLILVGSIAIAIFKHHLFNIKVIATELLIFLLWIFTLARVFMSVNLQDRLVNLGMLAVSLVIGILLIRSVLKEVKSREDKEKLAEQLAVANVRLRALDQAKSDFITIASHQLRAPLTAIKGYSSLIMEGSYGPLTEKLKDPLNKVFASASHMVVLIDDFLNLSRIERGKMEFTFDKVDFKQIIKDLFDELVIINSKSKKKLALSLEVEPGEKFELMMDGLKVRQVASNMLDNSVKYTDKGEVKVFLYKNKEKNSIVFKIQDTGVGMTPETQAHIFQKFVRASGASNLHAEGTGLGLYVAKKIMDVHQGRIWGESEGLGKGSTFYMELPLNFTPPAKIEIQDDALQVETPSGAKSVQEFVTKM